ncbi:MAG TPA: M20/M25/M40 family metallo-hydrolase [Bryobacteraceae bacterium]|nr:M20/M25/M40 family metallo-hydrolase [Bryobacteraceae bacterium]
MDVFELTRALVDIESITGSEGRAGEFLLDYLSGPAARFGGRVERMEVEPGRFNVFAQWGEQPTVTLSTHMDTVPPFSPSREDGEHVWGRGSCDAKGIIASMTKAAEGLLEAGERNFGLLFVVGEERNSAGAYRAAEMPRGSRYLVNGEPTENQVALGSKGALRYEVVSTGKMAHSAYPELGESAIHKLIEALGRILAIELPEDPVLGASTLNVGTISGGRAPNVVADEARAEILIRLVGDSEGTKRALEDAVRSAGGQQLAELREILELPAMRLGAPDGLATTVVAFTTDIPAFGGRWGEPFLVGPGSIHVAHTPEERVPKRELLEAVEIYQQLIRQLCKRESK